MIFTIAFEGMNRAGKGTQLALLRHWLHSHHFPVVILRGDGSRDGKGLELGDPADREWSNFKRRLELAHPSQCFALWNKAAVRLALEFFEWKEQKLPEMMNTHHSDVGFILLDRSLISRLLLRFDETRVIELENCYPGQDSDMWKRLLPEVIFHLDAPQEVLLSRLAANDPKHAFRREMIVEKYPLYRTVVERLPNQLSERCIPIDATQPVTTLYTTCLHHLQDMLAQR